MRLLHTKQLDSGNFAIEEFTDYNTPPYAILSHTWGNDEVSFQDMEGDGAQARTKKGFEKIKDCCLFARANGFDYAWVDTCCIDKASSAELSEALNSMYRWYEEAEICYAYLADITSTNQFSECRWFDRGWTLQELIAPTELLFVNKDWEELGNKKALQQEVSTRTGIPSSLLSGESDLDTFSVAQKMSWAAHRKTTRTEDRAYSLMGLFGVHMPLLYGERETAFVRLQKEILQISDDHTIFAWRDTDRRAGLLAPSPASFSRSHDIIPYKPSGSRGSPPTVSSRGIYLELPFVGLGPEGLGLVLLPCKEKQGDRLIAIYLRDLFMTMEQFERVWSNGFKLVDPQQFGPFQSPIRRICVQVGRMTRQGIHQSAGKWDGSPRERLGLEYDYLHSMVDRSLIRRAIWDIDRVWLVLTQSNDGLLEALDEFCQTPLLWAAKNGHEGIAKVLLDRGALLDGSTGNDVTGISGRPLTSALKNGHDGVAKMFIERGAGRKTDPNDRTPLSIAAKLGRGDIVKALLDGGADVEGNHFDRLHGLRPLTCAIVNGHEAIAEALIEKGATRKTDPKNDRTPLSLAAKLGRGAIVKTLLDGGADVEGNHHDKVHGLQPLTCAIENGHEAIAEALIERGAAHNIDPNTERTALSLAAQFGCGAIVELLLEAGHDVEGSRYDRIYGVRPLISAIENSHEAIATLLIEKGARLETEPNTNGATLSLAAKFGCEAIVELLLERGADVEGNRYDRMNGTRPLTSAIENGHEAIAAILIDRGAKLETKNSGGRTPLVQAAMFGRESTVRLLLEAGAPVQGRDDSGRSPLSWALQKGHNDIVKLLLDKGATFGPKDRDRNSQHLIWAIQNEDTDCSELLLRAGTSIEAPDKFGLKPLILAVEKGYEPNVRLLLERGASADVKVGRSGRTALVLAAEKGDLAIVELLLQRGARVEMEDSPHLMPLWWAVQNESETMVRLLLENIANHGVAKRRRDITRFLPSGKDLNMPIEYSRNYYSFGNRARLDKDDLGRTPLSLAEKKGLKGIVKLLREAKQLK